MGIVSIGADGWQAVYASVPVGPLILEDVAVSRAGFTSAGAASNFAETLKLTKRIRQPYPNQASLSADKVALSDFLYSTDTIAGVANNSALASPKPIAKWVSLDRSIVGNSVSPELVAFHRDGIACVEFRATDGSTSVTAMVSAAIVLGAATDQNAVIGYRATLDLTALSDGLITVHAKVYPRLGSVASGSVRDSTDVTARREFSARYYRKSGTLLAAPMYAYVAVSGGNDTTGAVSATAATAEASPCATVAGALNRINAVHGAVDGCIIRVMAGTHVMLSTASTRTQSIAAVTITRDPNAARSAVILQSGTTNFNPRLSGSLNATVDTGCIRFHDITYDRVGATYGFAGDSGKRLEVQFSDCVVDLNGVNAAFGNGVDFWWAGDEIIAPNSSATQAFSTNKHMMWRGCFGTMGGVTMEGYCVVGCDFNQAGRLANGALSTADGQVRAFNRLIYTTTAGSNLGLDSLTSNLSGSALVQNLIEGLPNTSYTMLVPSADGGTISTSHLVCLHNTIAGFNDAGRSNILYNETLGTPRTHTLHRVAGNIHCQLNTKHDVFMLDGTRTGGWSYLFGVGCDGEFTQYADAGTFELEYDGAGANIGTSSTVRNDPLFVDYQGATIGGAGAGGGDYTLQSGSPAIGILSREWLAFDLAGRARTRKVSGALEPDLPLPFRLSARGGAHQLRSQVANVSLTHGVRPGDALHAVLGAAAALWVVQVSRVPAIGRVLRVDGDSRTLWAGRD